MTKNHPQLSDAILNAERAVIGACLVEPKALRDLQLEVGDFVHFPHQAVFAAMRNLEAANKPIDTLSVEMQLSREGKLEAVGGITELFELSLAPPLVAHVEEYAWSVRDAAVKRRIAAAASELIARANDPRVSGDDLLGDATAKLGAIDGVQPEQVETIGELAQRAVDDIERFAQEKAAGRAVVTGAPTGVRALDDKVGGWQFGIVNLLAARPGMGKSSMALATADSCSANGIGVHVFSLEDSWRAYTHRQLSRMSGVPAIDIRRADWNADIAGRVAGAKHVLKQRKGWLVDHRSALTAREIVRCVRRNAEKHKTRLVVVDYVQLVRPRDPRSREDQQLGDTLGTFAEAAKADDMAYLVLSQLNREVEKRPDKRPQLSDLRGSGELEEKCKLAVGLYRGSYYGDDPKSDIDYDCDCSMPPNYCSKKHKPDEDQWRRDVQCIVLKGGNGPTGHVFATWDGPTVSIS